MSHPHHHPHPPHHHHHPTPGNGSTVSRSFPDYQLMVDKDDDDDNDNEQHDLDVEGLVGRLDPFTTTPVSFRRVVYSAASAVHHSSHNNNNVNQEYDEIYFDEDTTLPSRTDLATEPQPMTGEQEQEEQESFSPQRQRRRRRHSTLATSLRQPQQVPPLNRKNYLNLVTYVLHLFTSWGIGIWGLNGVLETRWQITTRYESLVTPAPWSYHLWFPILALEGLGTAAQCLAHYRNRPLVQDGIAYWFFYTFVWQTAWTLLFSFQCFVASFCSVLLALVCLVALLVSQLHAQSSSSTNGFLVQRNSGLGGGIGIGIGGGNKRYWEFVLFHFPFLLHAGWMVLMVVDHLALLFRAFDTSLALQVAIDVLALALMLACGVACLLRPPYQDFVIPAVIVWSFLGIAARCGNPSHAMQQLYGPLLIQAVQYAAQFLAGTLTACLLPCIVVWLSRELCVIHVVEVEE